MEDREDLIGLESSIELYADLIEFISERLLALTNSEHEMLKIVRIGALRVIANTRDSSPHFGIIEFLIRRP
jgi:hypothetical protein